MSPQHTAALIALALTGACVQSPGPVAPESYGGGGGPPPASEAMDPASALGLYRTNFGPVKIVLDDQTPPSGIMGVWVYDRSGQQVTGFFRGALEGNVLSFRWEEPADPAPLTGGGYLVFAADGSSFYGKWWTETRDRGGDWTGARADAGQPPQPGQPDQPPPPEYEYSQPDSDPSSP